MENNIVSQASSLQPKTRLLKTIARADEIRLVLRITSKDLKDVEADARNTVPTVMSAKNIGMPTWS